MNASEHTPHSSEWHGRIQDALDGELDSAERAEIRTHLEDCAECRAEYAKLASLDERLQERFAAPPELGADFSARVLANIETAANAQRAAAKVRAEQEFRRRMHAFSLDWREVWQRHLGNVVAGVAAFAAVAAAASALWESAGEAALAAIDKAPALSGSFMLPTVFVVGAASCAAATLWWLRTKTH